WDPLGGRGAIGASARSLSSGERRHAGQLRGCVGDRAIDQPDSNNPIRVGGVAMSVYVPSADAAPALAVRSKQVGFELARRSTVADPVNQNLRALWFTLLLSAICLEGLGRRYLPWIPAAVFYFLKDVVLLLGLIRFGINPDVRRAFSSLYGRFATFLK